MKNLFDKLRWKKNKAGKGISEDHLEGDSSQEDAPIDLEALEKLISSDFKFPEPSQNPFQKRKRNNSHYYRKLNEDFSLLNLLEYERKRLIKLKTFFNDKITNEDALRHSYELIRKEKRINLDHKKKIVKVLVEPNSPLQENLEEIFKVCFQYSKRRH